MADFSTPFGNADAARRLPTSDERQAGYSCGPLDKGLMEGLVHRIEAELGEVISFAGITPTDDRFTQVREAIEAIVAAATGAADTSNYLLRTQARATLPIYPHVWGGHLPVSQPAAGVIRLGGGAGFTMGGIDAIYTVQTDFNTLANKLYHLRYDFVSGFRLRDLADPTYNPGGYSHITPGFDTTYTDMLVATIATNGSNVATITTHLNQAGVLKYWATAPVTGISLQGKNLASGNFVFNYNFSRTPASMVARFQHDINESFTERDDLGRAITNVSRFGTSGVIMIDGMMNADVQCMAIA